MTGRGKDSNVNGGKDMAAVKGASEVVHSRYCIYTNCQSLLFRLLVKVFGIYIVFSMRILEGVKCKTSQADYDGPKQQCSLSNDHMFQVRHNPTGGEEGGTDRGDEADLH